MPNGMHETSSNALSDAKQWDNRLAEKSRIVVDMVRQGFIALGLLSLAACGTPYEADPVSVYQWERRQEEIIRRDAEKQRLCQTLDEDSARYKRECAGVRS